MKKFFWAAFLCASLMLAAFASPFASGLPDGLERVAMDRGFAESARGGAFSVFGDYSLTSSGGFISTSLAGVAGTLAVFAVAYALGRLIASGKGRK